MVRREKLGIISLKTIQRNKINKKNTHTRAAGDCKKNIADGLGCQDGIIYRYPTQGT